MGFTQWLNQISKDISSKGENKGQNKVFLFDMADVYFDSANDSQFDNISKLLSSLIEQNRVLKEVVETNQSSKVIFIMRDLNNIHSLLTHRNIEYSSVKIPLPDVNERKDVFSNLSRKFGINNVKDLKEEGPILEEALSLTSGLSYKEILQLARIDTEEDISFKALFHLAQFNKKESEWEKINYEKMQDGYKYFSSRVKGQDFAIKKIISTIKAAITGVTGITAGGHNNKPKGTLFFAGSTGIGKTELAKTIAQFVFGDEKRLLRFDMSEFSQEQSDQRLIGAPPGYVGHDAGGELTNQVKENPYSIILFDEIEKANPKILDKFLQILEDGRLTSSRGELVDFSESMIIFTSNIGAADINIDNKVIKADKDDGKIKKDQENIREKFILAVSKYFKEKLKRPELLNRIGKNNIVPFNFINQEGIIKEIIDYKLDKIKKIIREKHNVSLVIDESMMDDIHNLLIEKYEIDKGGRGVGSELEKHLIIPLSDFIFDNFSEIKKAKNKKEFYLVNLSISKDKIKFSH